MQVLNVEAFEKRVVYNVAKAYTNQLDVGEAYPALDDVIGISICDFVLWPPGPAPVVPLCSRWRMQEQTHGALGLSQLQFVFLDHPKCDAARGHRRGVERGASFSRGARRGTTPPRGGAPPPVVEALEAARTARFTSQEWDAYIAAGMALQNERGALALARTEG